MPIEKPKKLPKLPREIFNIFKQEKIEFFEEIPKNLSILLKREYKVTTTFKGGE